MHLLWAVIPVNPDEWVGWQDAGARPADVVGAVRDAVEPAVEAAKVVLDKIKEINPGTVEVKFGISVSGGVNWGIAKAAAEGSFEVTLSWSSGCRAARVCQPASARWPAGGGVSTGDWPHPGSYSWVARVYAKNGRGER